jgi:cytochrome c
MTRATLLSALLAVSTAAFAEDLPAGDAAAGAQVFKRCAACHAVGEGAPNKVGPELNGLFGRTAGSVPNYNYSSANKASGIVWTAETFADYIRNPRGVIKGTKMAFAGLKKDEDIADLIAYLAQFDADGGAKP